MRGIVRILAIAAAAVTMFGGTLFVAGGDSAKAADTTLNLIAGGGEPGFSINQFFAREVRIQKDTTLHWTFPWLEIHTVTFGVPQGDPTQPTAGAGTSVVQFDGTQFISSGLIAGPDAKLDVKFTKAGTYDYYCVIHPLMTGKVTVVESGSVDTQATIDARANGEFQAANASIKQLASNLKAQPVAITPKAGGGNQYTVIVGGVDAGGNDVQQFIPATLTLKEKDSIEWLATSPTPHTVTFNANLLPPGDPFELPETKPAGGFDGTGLATSPIIGAEWPGGTKFVLQFNKAGSYDYICILHSDQAMVGTVKVEAAPVVASPTAVASPTTRPPAPPATGTGDSGSSTNMLLILGGAVAAAVIAFGGGAVAVRRTR